MFSLIFQMVILTIENLYHPLLSHPVKNTIKIEENIIIVNGANMAGKSTFLWAFFMLLFGNIGWQYLHKKRFYQGLMISFIFWIIG